MNLILLAIIVCVAIWFLASMLPPIPSPLDDNEEDY